jgi:hypothetical protein
MAERALEVGATRKESTMKYMLLMNVPNGGP